jgi:hypothetical protein
MSSKPNIILPTIFLGAIAVVTVWQNSAKRERQPGPATTRSVTRATHPKSPRLESVSRKPAQDLPNDELLAIYHRDGAAAALAAAKSQPWPNREGLVFFILSQMVTEDPEFAAAELKTSGLSAYIKTALLEMILKNWSDGRKALDWAENQLTGELRCKAVAGALGILGRWEPEAAFAYLEKIPVCEARSQAICDLFASWGSSIPLYALLKARQLAPEEAQSATEHVLRSWAKFDPESAAAWVLATEPTNEKWIAGVIQSWVTLSPEKAKRWFDSLPGGDGPNFAGIISGGGTATYSFSTIPIPTDHSWASKPISERNDTDLMNWAIQDTENARTFVERNGSAPASNQLAVQVARAIAGKNGPSAATDWVLRLSEENENRKTALRYVYFDWAENEPVAAGEKLASIPPEHQDTLPLILVNIWLKEDPAAAADWAARWNGANQSTMIEKVIDQWPNQDPNAAYQWLGSLPAGAGRDAGIKAMIRREQESAPETLLPWIALISDPQLREEARVELNDLLKAAHDK